MSKSPLRITAATFAAVAIAGSALATPAQAFPGEDDIVTTAPSTAG